MMRRSKHRWLALTVGLAVAFGAIQLVPYGRDHRNPSTTAEPPWDSPETRAMARRACFDCHSNETVWPGYARVAPVSWLVQRDVTEGRAVLNFSEWQRPQEEAAEAPDEVRAQEMPPVIYRIMHAEARLSAPEREALARGLANTLAAAGKEDSGR